MARKADIRLYTVKHEVSGQDVQDYGDQRIIFVIYISYRILKALRTLVTLKKSVYLAISLIMHLIQTSTQAFKSSCSCNIFCETSIQESHRSYNALKHF